MTDDEKFEIVYLDVNIVRQGMGQIPKYKLSKSQESSQRKTGITGIERPLPSHRATKIQVIGMLE